MQSFSTTSLDLDPSAVLRDASESTIVASGFTFGVGGSLPLDKLSNHWSPADTIMKPVRINFLVSELSLPSVTSAVLSAQLSDDAAGTATAQTRQIYITRLGLHYMDISVYNRDQLTDDVYNYLLVSHSLMDTTEIKYSAWISQSPKR